MEAYIDMDTKDLSFDEIKVNDSASFSRTWTEKDVAIFSKLSGDANPLHMDDAYARTTSFGRRLVHGMLVASLCSRFVGMYLPGKRCLYLSQTLFFKRPVFVGDTVSVFGSVIAKSEVTKILTISMVIKKGEEVVVEGETHARVL